MEPRLATLIPLHVFGRGNPVLDIVCGTEHELLVLHAITLNQVLLVTENLLSVAVLSLLKVKELRVSLDTSCVGLLFSFT